MNLICGQLDWLPAGADSGCAAGPHGDAVVDLSVERIPWSTHTGPGRTTCPKTGLLCAMVGYISNLADICTRHSLKQESDIDLVRKLYALLGPDAFKELDGSYTVFIWDPARQQAHIVQDEYASSLPLYYASTDTGINFSTSLRRLLPRLSAAREFDLDSVHDFLFAGRHGNALSIVPRDTTLVRNVKRLLPGRRLEIDTAARTVSRKSLTVSRTHVSRTEAQTGLLDSIEQCIRTLVSARNGLPAFCSLSSGYDSNFILSCARRAVDGPIHAVTIGGLTKSEIPAAAGIVQQYHDVEHHARVVPEDALRYLPDIVWRYEGFLCEIGVFLQYELAAALADMGSRSALLGDCADQRLDCYRFSPTGKIVTSLYGLAMRTAMRLLKGNDFSARLSAEFRAKARPPLADPYIEQVARKTGIMLNSLNIQALFPFLNKETTAMSHALGRLNWRKAHFNQQVKNLLPPEVRALLARRKIGGSTWIGYLFTDRTEIISRLLAGPTAELLLTGKQIAAIADQPDRHTHFILQLMYLHLFHELIITGKHDAHFEQPRLDIPLEELI